MKKHFAYISFLGLSCVLMACSSPTDTAHIPQAYFDLKGFVNTQISELGKRKPLVKKQMSVEGKTETLQTTEIDWSKELELFTQSDLNKQAYLLSYHTTQPDANTLLYTLKEGEKLPVKSLKIVLHATSQKPERVEIQMSEDNKLYDSAKTLSLTATMRPEGVWMVKTYEVSGFQHLALTSQKAFRIKGIIQ